MAVSQQLEDKYIVRLPDGMRDQLKAMAAINKRSMNAEIVARLEASFSTPSHDHDAIKQALREVLEERDARPERPALQVQGQVQ